MSRQDKRLLLRRRQPQVKYSAPIDVTFEKAEDRFYELKFTSFNVKTL
jgi:hypothetical protein